MICRHCNNNVPNGSEYCTFCGNVLETVQEDNISNIDRGYAYLELKEWENAKKIFNFAIVNNENKARAYIGRLLADMKLSDFEKLPTLNKKLTQFDDFNLALKYADDYYKQLLEDYCSLVEEKVERKQVKSKKCAVVTSISCISLIILLLLTYFAFIPYGRFSHYKSLLSKGKIEKATKSYSNSKWFEFDKKSVELFYNKGVSLVENKDYKNAEVCFLTTKNFKDSNNYQTYCKAQQLLAEDNLESYNYFTECIDFLDSKNILETNEYFVLVDKLQGKWKRPNITKAEREERDRERRNSGKYYEYRGSFYDKSSYVSYEDFIATIENGQDSSLPGKILGTYEGPEKIEISGIELSGIGTVKDDLIIIKGEGVGFYVFNKNQLIELIDDTHFKLFGKEYKKFKVIKNR